MKMKAKYLLFTMVGAALAFGFTACSDDDDDSVIPTPPKVEKSNLAFDADTVIVNVHETATFNITDGGGDYKIINENPDIAEGTVENNTVTVTSQSKGITGLIISDATGNYKRIMVKSMYNKMALNKESVTIGMKLGHDDGVGYATVLEGNGNYKAVSENEDIAKVSGIRGDSMIVVQGVSEGTTNITVTDMMGLTQTFKVTVEVTTVPYTDEEKAEILKVTEDVIKFDSETTYWGSFTADVNGSPKIEYRYYTYDIQKIFFDGDFSVGKKKNGKFTTESYWGDGEEWDNVEVEILKNDGSRIWGIMSVVKDDYLHYGYFTVAI
jgi:hypothetical protein